MSSRVPALSPGAADCLNPSLAQMSLSPHLGEHNYTDYCFVDSTVINMH